MPVSSHALLSPVVDEVSLVRRGRCSGVLISTANVRAYARIYARNDYCISLNWHHPRPGTVDAGMDTAWGYGWLGKIRERNDSVRREK